MRWADTTPAQGRFVYINNSDVCRNHNHKKSRESSWESAGLSKNLPTNSSSGGQNMQIDMSKNTSSRYKPTLLGNAAVDVLTKYTPVRALAVRFQEAVTLLWHLTTAPDCCSEMTWHHCSRSDASIRNAVCRLDRVNWQKGSGMSRVPPAEHQQQRPTSNDSSLRVPYQKSTDCYCSHLAKV